MLNNKTEFSTSAVKYGMNYVFIHQTGGAQVLQESFPVLNEENKDWFFITFDLTAHLILSIHNKYLSMWISAIIRFVS